MDPATFLANSYISYKSTISSWHSFHPKVERKGKTSPNLCHYPRPTEKQVLQKQSRRASFYPEIRRYISRLPPPVTRFSREKQNQFSYLASKNGASGPSPLPSPSSKIGTALIFQLGGMQSVVTCFAPLGFNPASNMAKFNEVSLRVFFVLR